MSVSESITAAALRHGVDPSLALAVAQQESNLNQNARSGAGAIGVFQLMPATAADLGVDPYDTEQNIEGGVKYLAQMLKRFDGDTTLALAAYNAGPGNVSKYGGVPPFAETQTYVSRILTAIGFAPDSPVGGQDSGDGGPVEAGMADVSLVASAAIAAGLVALVYLLRAWR